jgi:hypothetical protein
MTADELAAVRQRNETDGIFGPLSIHAPEVYKDAQTDRRNLLAHIERLEAALREIAIGLITDDQVAGIAQRYQICAGRLCKIARDALTAPETKAEPIEDAPDDPPLLF